MYWLDERTVLELRLNIMIFFQIDQVSVNRSRTSDNKNSTTNKTDSETADTASIVSSPGRPQPVNFDFHRQDTLRRDPTIIQPVAIRRSPDSPVVQSSDLDEEDDQHQVQMRALKFAAYYIEIGLL